VSEAMSWVYTNANIVMGAESADFFFYCWYLKVLADDGVWHVPGGINYQTQDFEARFVFVC
jgi:hypothetical protein